MRKHVWAFDLFGIAALGLFFFLASCGGQSPSTPTGAHANGMSAGGKCEQAFVTDYQGIRNYSQSEYDRARVSAACQDFKRKYAGVRCTVDDFDYSTYTQRSYTIDAGAEMDAIINQSMY